MPLYQIAGEQLDPIKAVAFGSEKEIQSITEKNLTVIFGLELVKSEFTCENFRIDTLGFDNETRSFVVIEYKKDKNFSVVDQGYAYLSLMLNNKSDFILEYNETLKKTLQKNAVDWSQSRVIFVSPSFTDYQRQAIKFKDLPIELWEARRFSNSTMFFNRLKPTGATASFKETQAKRGKTHVDIPPTIYTEDYLFETRGASSGVREAFSEIKKEISDLDEGIEEKITKTMACFYSGGRGMVWIAPFKNRITLHLRKGTYRDRLRRISKEGWGKYPVLTLKEDEFDDRHMKYLSDLFRQAYDMQ